MRAWENENRSLMILNALPVPVADILYNKYASKAN